MASESKQRDAHDEFWALKDVSFEVKQGDVVGIIGRNGAGKSTLLKLLSRITEPTSGRIALRGRVASLLEVGTGFHQELTGRENIYLNGAILGMSRIEIRRKFDEIVAFSEVEKFLEMPVKRYSSGMYVRLAFAVAAHMEPDILVIDEVLAVGDSAFQQKCLGKIDQVSTREGRTVLFVSHNMGVISRLCKKTVLLESGRLRCAGDTVDMISQYLNSGANMQGATNMERPCRYGRLRIYAAVAACDAMNSETVGAEIDITKPVCVEFSYRVTRQIPRFRVSLRFLASDGSIAFHSADSTHPQLRREAHDTRRIRDAMHRAWQSAQRRPVLDNGVGRRSVSANIVRRRDRRCLHRRADRRRKFPLLREVAGRGLSAARVAHGRVLAANWPQRKCVSRCENDFHPHVLWQRAASLARCGRSTS